MNVALHRPWTPDQFLLWVEAQQEPYEFDGSRPVAMTRGNNNHARLIRSILGALDRRPDRAAFEALGPETGIATLAGAVRYPDVLVARSPIDGRARTVSESVVVRSAQSSRSANTLQSPRSAVTSSSNPPSRP